jgi:excisionase family DNA binding protein
MEANLQEKNDNTNTFELLIESIVERLFDEKFSSKEKELREAAEPKKYYTRKEVCEIYHVSLMTLHNWVMSGKLVQRKIGKRVLFDRQEVDDAVKTQQVFRYQHKG